jgi:hypothetical protein
MGRGDLKLIAKIATVTPINCYSIANFEISIIAI